ARCWTHSCARHPGEIWRGHASLDRQRGALPAGGRTQTDSADIAMKLANISTAAIDWRNVPNLVQAGETGTPAGRTQNVGDMRLRLVTYSSGYLADHWCDKGHVLHVIAGSIIIEYRDQTRVVLDAGMSWHAPDGASPAHRVVCESDATVFIVD